MHTPLVTASLITALIAASAAARPESTLAEPDTRDAIITFSPSATYSTEASLDSEPGDFSLATTSGNLAITFFPADSVTMIAGLDHETAYYDFSDATSLIPGTDSPIDLAHTTSISLSTIFKQDNNVSYLFSGTATSALARGADFADSLTYRLAAGVQFRVSEDLTLSFGGGFRTRLENNAIAIPLIQFRWTIDEQTRLTSEGLGLKLAHDLDADNTIHLRAGYEIREYRLDEDTPTARDGSFEHQRFPLAIGWTHAPDDNFSIAFEAGAILWQEIEVRTGSGNRISEIDADPSAFFAITVDIRF